MLCLTGYMYANASWAANGEQAVATWFPVLSLFLFYACSTIGYLIVPWVMIGEVFPRQIRGMIGGVSTCVGHFSIFIVLQTYPLLQEWVTQPGTFAVYGAVSLLCTWFLFRYCPETKGKTLQEIEESFGKKKPPPSRKPIVARDDVNRNINNNCINANADGGAENRKCSFPDLMLCNPSRRASDSLV